MGGFEYATRPYFISFVNLLGCVTQRTPSTDGLRPSFEGRTIISSLYSAPKRYYFSIPLVSTHNNRKNEAFLRHLSLTTMLGSNGPNLVYQSVACSGTVQSLIPNVVHHSHAPIRVKSRVFSHGAEPTPKQ